MKIKDYSVSLEDFEIWECSSCTVRFTQDIPDQQSIGRYYKSEDYISHTSSSKGIINRLYHAVRRVTLKNKKNLIQSITHLSAGNLLDVGAGTGAFIHYMQQYGWGTTALEPDADARKRAMDLYSIKLLEPDVLFRLPEKSFDVITLWHVLEHVHALHDYISQLKKLIYGDGKIFIAVPNYTSFDAMTYHEAWAAYDVPRHLYHFSPASMKKLLQIHALRLGQVKPMWFDSFYVSLLSEKYRKAKVGLVSGFWNGLVSNGKALINKSNTSSLIYVVGR